MGKERGLAIVSLTYIAHVSFQAKTIFKNKTVGEMSFYPFAATYLKYRMDNDAWLAIPSLGSC